MPGPEAQSGSAAALALLDTLEIKGRAPKTGYSRDKFGQAWSDDVSVEMGHDGCDTRNNVLQRDLTNIVVKPGTRNCVIVSGTLNDPYSGKVIRFTRGENTSSAIQIDHIVALSNAWQTGAQQLDEQARRNFANDPRNLLAVDGPANQQKSDGDAATWLPANKAYRCTYVSKQVDVKAAYHLWVTPPEKDAIVRILQAC
ncbi:MAG: HNH endonuclease family protein [Candidatus Nanopelagicales bacterium]